MHTGSTRLALFLETAQWMRVTACLRKQGLAVSHSFYNSNFAILQFHPKFFYLNVCTKCQSCVADCTKRQDWFEVQLSCLVPVNVVTLCHCCWAGVLWSRFSSSHASARPVFWHRIHVGFAYCLHASPSLTPIGSVCRSLRYTRPDVRCKLCRLKWQFDVFFVFFLNKSLDH